MSERPACKKRFVMGLLPKSKENPARSFAVSINKRTSSSLYFVKRGKEVPISASKIIESQTAANLKSAFKSLNTSSFCSL